MKSFEKRVSSLEEKAPRIKAERKRNEEITIQTSPGGTSMRVRPGAMIRLPGGNEFRMPRSGLSGKVITLLAYFYPKGRPVPNLPDPAEEIVRQRDRGEKWITVRVPYEIGDET